MPEYYKDLQKYIEYQIEKYGGLRKAATNIGVDASILSKIKKGTYLPKEKTVEKMFPGFKTDAEYINVYVTPGKVTMNVSIECDDFDILKQQLDILGYKIMIVPK